MGNIPDENISNTPHSNIWPWTFIGLWDAKKGENL
jgi:hypothetical protein